MDKKNNRRTLFLSLVGLAVVLTLGISYAYFSAITDNNRNQSADLSTAVLALRFADRDNGLKAEMNFGDTVTKKFLIENTGTAEASLSLDWKNLVNTYLNGSLTYRLTYSETEDGEYKELIPETNVPVSRDRISQAIASEISVPTGETYYYNLDITLNSTEVDQSADLDAVFNTEFDVGEPAKYRYYRLTVNPAGGEWNEHTTSQEYLLKNRETQDIPNPTRVGYTFTGWSIQGVSSSLEDTTFTMGISDTYLVAQWEAIEYQLTINYNCPNEKLSSSPRINVTMSTATEISNSICNGYTFTGWTADGGIVESNENEGYTFTLTEARNPSITGNWQINNYKYIVYHNQMNIDGEGYTLVSADTDEGEAEYKSTVTPETKTYTGFTSPEKRTLTIQHETVYPPELNKIDYNYERNKYTLTIDPNGGTYDSETTVKMYYDYNAKLGKAPTRDGYKFDSWLASSGNVKNPQVGNISCKMVEQITGLSDGCYTWFQIGAEDATITAQWTPKEYSVTFNDNGGTVDTPSKVVTYDSQYGDLPEPTYSGYTFLGWFTEQEGGTQITSNSTVSILDNQTLYAHWELAQVEITLDFSYSGQEEIESTTFVLNKGQRYYDVLSQFIGTSGTYYTLDGWYFDEALTQEITEDTVVTNLQPHTVYAYWTPLCFVAGTQVLTETGFKNIEDIKAGEKVYTINLDTNERVLNKVIRPMQSKTNSLYKIYAGDEIIEATPRHEFYIQDKGWVRARDLVEGDILPLTNNGRLTIDKIEYVELPEPITVYNLHVENNHNYLITEEAILVHNLSIGPDFDDLE